MHTFSRAISPRPVFKSIGHGDGSLVGKGILLYKFAEVILSMKYIVESAIRLVVFVNEVNMNFLKGID